mgnify:CR=1 FL=1
MTHRNTETVGFSSDSLVSVARPGSLLASSKDLRLWRGMPILIFCRFYALSYSTRTIVTTLRAC